MSPRASLPGCRMHRGLRGVVRRGAACCAALAGLGTAGAALASEPVGPAPAGGYFASVWQERDARPLDLHARIVRGQDEEGGIRDNSFLIEEAYNQEQGIIQHIFNFVRTWDEDDGQFRGWDTLYTLEMPLGSQTHQFSFTIPFSNFHDAPDGGTVVDENGLGDIQLNYRYQWRDGSDGGPAVAPRMSVILPSGNPDRDLGDDVVGYQLNLPVSYESCCRAYHFNAGMTIRPDVVADLGINGLSEPRDLVGYNLGMSVIDIRSNTLQPLVEMLMLWDEEIDDLGVDRSTFELLVSPGVRWAPYTEGDTQVVLGAALPVGLTRDAPDLGLFLYFSFEHRIVAERSE